MEQRWKLKKVILQLQTNALDKCYIFETEYFQESFVRQMLERLSRYIFLSTT